MGGGGVVREGQGDEQEVEVEVEKSYGDGRFRRNMQTVYGRPLLYLWTRGCMENSIVILH